MNDVVTINEAINTAEQTPIEITLEVDETGWTTAKKLYDWLELDPSHFSRWCEDNIVDNKYVDEIEFSPLMAKTSNKGGRPFQDYAISADLAKMLAISSKSEKGNIARDYFRKVEEGLKVTVKQYNDVLAHIEKLEEQIVYLNNRITQRNQMSIWEQEMRKKLNAWKDAMPPRFPLTRNAKTDEDIFNLFIDSAMAQFGGNINFDNYVSTYSAKTGDYKPSVIKVADYFEELRTVFDEVLSKHVENVGGEYRYIVKNSYV